MSKQKDLFKFHGKLDNVVGFKSRGTHYTRMAPCTNNDVKTPKRLIQRAKFAAVTQFIQKFGLIYKADYHHYNTSINQRANFFRQIWNNALIGTPEEGYSIDPTKVDISSGSLTPCHSIAASVTPASQTVTVSWSDNTGVGEAQPTDQLMFCFFNLSKETNIYGNNVASRDEESYSFTYPADWAGDTCYLYVAWASGSSESVSKMLGIFTA